MDFWTGLYFLNFLNVVFSTSGGFYTVHLENQGFEDALASCWNDDSFLTNMANQQETVKILKAIAEKTDQTVTSFWIGLSKNKTQCVQENLPLKGFSWIVDNSIEFEDAKWKTEPSGTCTNALCGLLSVEYRNSTIESWLVSSSCKQKHPFICKHERESKKKPCPDPSITEPHDIMQKMTDPYTLTVTCKDKETFTLTCSKTTNEWTVVGSPKTDILQLCKECQTGYKKNIHGQCVDVDECEQSHTCKHGCRNTVGSYVCTCPDGTDEDSENCKKADKPPSSKTSPDDVHFQGETTHSSTKKMPQANSTGSVDIEEGTGDPSNIVIPVIIALLIFVVLVVIIVGIVKCCLIRRAKKRAKKRAEASKESMALNGSDSMEKVNAT